MEHVSEYHGNGMDDKIRVRVMENLNPIEIPKTAKQFWAFPEKQGWKVDNFVLRPGPDLKCNLDFLLQAWLFFGLCFTVIQKDSEPILTYDQLLKDNILSTKKLNKALNKWYDCEKFSNTEDHNGLRLRMIQVGYMLDHARQVIRRNCACTDDNNTDNVERERLLYITDKHVLVLMCLGEALCEMKAKITRDFKVNMAGWHAADDQEGWGPPRFVLQKMKDKDWCPRAVRLLRGQFSAYATLLVSAYYACQGEDRAAPQHSGKGCTPDHCFAKSENEQNIYCARHICENHDGCVAVGPDTNRVLKILKKDDNVIPLLKFRDHEDEKGEVSFDVLEFDSNNPDHQFVAISHVWSDGWGNKDANELNCCQLKLIQRQIRRAMNNRDAPFWMDTLVIPVGKTTEKREAKKKAIRQISTVFSTSKRTIVIDNGLLSMVEGPRAGTAMQILSSGWVRRLWTLQEAHLSQSIYFAFEETDRSAKSLIDLQEVEKRLDSTEGSAAGINARVKNQLSQVMARHKSGKGANGNVNMPAREKAMTVANVWHAARWRTTSRAEHETLAIANLLGLEYKGTMIEEVELFDPQETKKDEAWRKTVVKILWEMLHNTHKGAIPAGIIFLPGDKINISGYAWAPKTWLSAHETTYPEPMNFWNSPTELGKDGLLVRYPGFILHTDSTDTRSIILGTAAKSSGFHFPVDRTLREWYNIKAAEGRSYCNLTRLQQSSSKLAIIASRLPSELPREIALLVEILEDSTQKESPEDYGGPDARDYRVKVIRRVYIWRHANGFFTEREETRLKTENFRSQKTNDFLLAEKLDLRQKWWVDGYTSTGLDMGVEREQKSQNTTSWGPKNVTRKIGLLNILNRWS